MATEMLNICSQIPLFKGWGALFFAFLLPPNWVASWWVLNQSGRSEAGGRWGPQGKVIEDSFPVD